MGSIRGSDVFTNFPTVGSLASCEQVGELQLNPFYSWVLRKCADDDVREILARLRLVTTGFRTAIEAGYAQQIDRDMSWIDRFDSLAEVGGKLQIFRSCRPLEELVRLHFKHENITGTELLTALNLLQTGSQPTLTHLDLRNWWVPAAGLPAPAPANPLQELLSGLSSTPIPQLQHLALDIGAAQVLHGVNEAEWKNKFPNLTIFSLTSMEGDSTLSIPEVIQKTAKQLFLCGISPRESMTLPVTEKLVLEQGAFQLLTAPELTSMRCRDVAFMQSPVILACLEVLLTNVEIERTLRIPQAVRVSCVNVEVRSLRALNAERVYLFSLPIIERLWLPNVKELAAVAVGAEADLATAVKYWNLSSNVAGRCLGHGGVVEDLEEQEEKSVRCPDCNDITDILRGIEALAI